MEKIITQAESKWQFRRIQSCKNCTLTWCESDLLSVLFASIVGSYWQGLYQTHPLGYFHLLFFCKLTGRPTDIRRRVVNGCIAVILKNKQKYEILAIILKSDKHTLREFVPVYNCQCTIKVSNAWTYFIIWIITNIPFFSVSGICQEVR